MNFAPLLKKVKKFTINIMFLIKIEWKDKLCCLKNCQIKTGMKIYLILLRTLALQNRVSKKNE